MTTELDVVDAGDSLMSLREAVAKSNQLHESDDTITFASSLAGKPMRLVNGQILITDTVTIRGLGAALTTVNGRNETRLFDITSSVGDVTFDGLTLTGGRTTADSEKGGAIRSLSTGLLNIRNSTISGNSTTGGFAGGGGIHSGFTVTLTNSTISGNSTTGDFAIGGGIYGSNAVRVINSTISGNSTTGDSARGGGIIAVGEVTVVNSTISGNSTTGDSAPGGGIYSHYAVTVVNSTITANSIAGQLADGGGLGSFNVTVHNSIIAGNFDTENVSHPDLWQYNNGTLDVRYSLIGDNNGTTFAPAPVGSPDDKFNLVGTHAARINPKLAPLADNGGPTQTRRLVVGSPAINAGSNALVVTSTDQRGAGFPRFKLGTVDMGAFELSVPPVVANFGGSVTYTENAPLALIARTATVSDPDHQFRLRQTGRAAHGQRRGHRPARHPHGRQYLNQRQRGEV